jgi:small subunit ribosomal protein S2
VDSNNSPENIDYIIPGNDDSIRAVKLYCETVANSVLEAKTARLDISVKDDEFVEEAATEVTE